MTSANETFLGIHYLALVMGDGDMELLLRELEGYPEPHQQQVLREAEIVIAQLLRFKLQVRCEMLLDERPWN